MAVKLFNLLLPLLLALDLYGAGTTQAERKSFLWELYDGEKHLYLLGSIHVAKQDLFPLKQEIEAAYNEAQAIAVEVDLNEAAKIMPLLLQQHAFLPPEKHIADVVSFESNALLINHMKQIRIDYDRISQMKPWYLSILISNISLERIGAKSYLGIDRYFTTRAYRDKKEVIELEGADKQLRMLDELPYSEQEYLMRSAILDDSRMESVFEEMVALWREGDLTGLGLFFESELTEYPELKAFNTSLITRRNRFFADKIIRLLDEKKCILVIIGAAHFTGEDGIVTILKQKGFRLIQR